MSSKRGVIITVVILVAITIASFSVWIGNNSTNTEMTILVTDFENHQEGISERHKIVSNAVEESFSELMNGGISPEEYIKIAEISSSQNTALLIFQLHQWLHWYLSQSPRSCALTPFSNCLKI